MKSQLCLYYLPVTPPITSFGRARPAFPREQDHIASDPSTLGDIAHKGDLPFLFKVISINKALSIQASAS